MKIIGHRSPYTGIIIIYSDPKPTWRYQSGYIRRRGKRYEECHRTPDRIEWRGVTREVKAAIAAKQEHPAP